MERVVVFFRADVSGQQARAFRGTPYAFTLPPLPRLRSFVQVPLGGHEREPFESGPRTSADLDK